MPKRGRGRPSKLTPERQKQIVENIQLCLPYELACQAADVSYPAFRQWMVKGEAQKSGKYRDFLEAIHEAESKALKGCVATIVSNVQKGNWKAAAWILERRHSDFFARLKHEIAGKDGKPIEVKHITDLTDEQLAAIAAGGNVASGSGKGDPPPKGG